MCLKDILKDSNKWKNIHYSWIGRLNIAKLAIVILPKQIYKFTETLMQTPSEFLFHLSLSSILPSFLLTLTS